MDGCAEEIELEIYEGELHERETYFYDDVLVAQDAQRNGIEPVEIDVRNVMNPL